MEFSPQSLPKQGQRSLKAKTRRLFGDHLEKRATDIIECLPPSRLSSGFIYRITIFPILKMRKQPERGMLPQVQNGWAGRCTGPDFREEKEKDSHSFNKNARMPLCQALDSGDMAPVALHSSGERLVLTADQITI